MAYVPKTKPAEAATQPAKVAAKSAVAPKPSALEKLNALVGAVKAKEDVVREEFGGQNSFIKIIGDPQAKELNSTKPEFIKGAKYGQFVIGNKKIVLGESFKAIIVGMFKLYEESELKEETKGGKDALPKIFGYWMPEDAENIPVEGMFDRPFVAKDKTNHVLKPVHWVALYLPDYPELTDVVLSFRSTGNGIYAKFAKALKAATAISSEVMVTITTQAIENKTWEKTNLFPALEITSKNFAITEDGIKLLSAKEGGIPESEIETILTLSETLNTEYAENKLVAKKANIQAYIGAPAKVTGALSATAGKPAQYEDADENEDAPKF